MSTRALTLAVRLLTTACAGAALGAMTGCPLLFSCPEPWSEVQTVELGTSADIFAITRGSRYDTLVAVGAGGVVVHHEGEPTSVSNPVNVTLRGVVSSGTTTIVVGDGGTILSSSDDGQTWESRDAAITDALLGVARLSTEAGSWVVAIASEQVVVSADEGVTWQVVPPPSEGWGGLRAVFASTSEVWLVGAGGSVWTTEDPGAAWFRQDLGTAADLLGGGPVYVDGNGYPSPVAVASADSLWLRELDTGEWTELDADLDGPIVAYGGGYLVTTNGSVYDVSESGYVERVANVGLVPLAITGNFSGFIVAGEGGNAARVNSQECLGGRPWVVDGVPRTAALVGEIPAAGHGSLGGRLALAWAADGLAEHASVASFARFVQELMSLGAPPGLVRAAQRAILDEIEHARLCLALASRHAGAPLGPGALPLLSNFANFGSVSDSRAGDPVAIALAVFEEGCINESIAAAEAAVAASCCGDEQAKAALERIAADETRHAALAWQTLRWLLDHHAAELGPALRSRVGALRARVGLPAGARFDSLELSGLACRPLPRAPSRVIQADHALRRHGRLSSHERAAIHCRVFAEMIAPLASRLLTVASEPALA